MLDKWYYPKALACFPLIPASVEHNIIIESVELWGGSSVSYASAASGDLFRLAFQIGAFIRHFKQLECSIFLVSPRTWKGQLNYKQLRFIFKKKYCMDFKNDHEASAFGIGFWAKGLF